jgi:hypothetical protein
MANLILRRATLADVPTLERWDREPHVIAATTDDPGAEKAFGDHDWTAALPDQSEVDNRYFEIERSTGAQLHAIEGALALGVQLWTQTWTHGSVVWCTAYQWKEPRGVVKA